MNQTPSPLPPVLREVEHKFSVAPLFDPPDLSVEGRFAVSTDPAFTQTAVYFDTRDLRLFRWGITLRRREGGTDDGWHLKLPGRGGGGGKHVRDEVHLPLTDDPRPPAAFTDLLGAFLRGAAVQPAVTLRTVRQVSHVTDAAGVEVAEVADDTVSVLNGRAIAARFREIEVEERGDGRAATEIVAALRRAGAIPSSISKAVAALGPEAQAEADVPRPAPVDPSTPAGAAVTAYLTGQVRALLFTDVQVRLGTPDSVHQLRVAVRRLRSAMRTFGPLIDAPVAADLRSELSWLAGELGPARDTEVLIDRLLADAATLDDAAAARVTAAVETALHPRLVAATEQALAALRSDRHAKLVAALVAAATELALPVAEPAGDVIPELVDRAFATLAKSARQLQPEGPSEDWHRTRILAKRARYAAESVVPIFGAVAAARAAALELVTECLGDHQDAWLAQQTLIELAQAADGPTGLALGLLVAHEVDREHDSRDRFRRVWPRVARANEPDWGQR